MPVQDIAPAVFNHYPTINETTSQHSINNTPLILNPLLFDYDTYPWQDVIFNTFNLALTFCALILGIMMYVLSKRPSIGDQSLAAFSPTALARDSSPVSYDSSLQTSHPTLDSNTTRTSTTSGRPVEGVRRTPAVCTHTHCFAIDSPIGDVEAIATFGIIQPYLHFPQQLPSIRMPLYANQRKLAEAEEMYHRALHGYRKALRLDDIVAYVPALNDAYSYGLLLENQGRITDAKLMYSGALIGYRAVFGSKYRWYLAAKERIQHLEDSLDSVLPAAVSLPDKQQTLYPQPGRPKLQNDFDFLESST